MILFFLVLLILNIGVFAEVDLSLYADTVIWHNDSTITACYGFSDTNQINDWSGVGGTSIALDADTLVVSGGSSTVRGMMFGLPIAATRIYVIHKPSTANNHHNLLVNVDDAYAGTPWNPDPGYGHVWRLNDPGYVWQVDGTVDYSDTADVRPDVAFRWIDYEIYDDSLRARNELNADWEVRAGTYVPDTAGRVFMGAYNGTNSFDTIAITGIINYGQNDTVVEDAIGFSGVYETFQALIETTGVATVTWIFSDKTTSSATNPDKSFNYNRYRTTYLKVDPWSSVRTLNLGYDESDGGADTIATLAAQSINQITGLDSLSDSLLVFCASYNPLTSLSFSGFTELNTIELYHAQSLEFIDLTGCESLKRLCVEDCDLDSIDFSDSPDIRDMRGALNKLIVCRVPAVADSFFHFCIRDNPTMTNVIDLSVYPELSELYIHNCNQSGALRLTHSSVNYIHANDNSYDTVDIAGCFPYTSQEVELQNNSIVSINVSATDDGIGELYLQNNNLSTDSLDKLLDTINAWGTSGKVLNISSNNLVSTSGRDNILDLESRSWTVTYDGWGFRITVIDSPDAGGTAVVSSGGTADSNSIDTVVPVPEAGYVFDRWGSTDDDTTILGDTLIHNAVDEDYVDTAYYESITIPPTVSTHPADCEDTVFVTCTTFVAATGTSPFTYQWMWKYLGGDWHDSTGLDNDSIFIQILPDMSGDSFKCEVSNAYGVDTSNAAVITAYIKQYDIDTSGQWVAGISSWTIAPGITDQDSNTVITFHLQVLPGYAFNSYTGDFTSSYILDSTNIVANMTVGVDIEVEPVTDSIRPNPWYRSDSASWYGSNAGSSGGDEFMYNITADDTVTTYYWSDTQIDFLTASDWPRGQNFIEVSHDNGQKDTTWIFIVIPAKVPY